MSKHLGTLLLGTLLVVQTTCLYHPEPRDILEFYVFEQRNQIVTTTIHEAKKFLVPVLKLAKNRTGTELPRERDLLELVRQNIELSDVAKELGVDPIHQVKFLKDLGDIESKAHTIFTSYTAGGPKWLSLLRVGFRKWAQIVFGKMRPFVERFVFQMERFIKNTNARENEENAKLLAWYANFKKKAKGLSKDELPKAIVELFNFFPV